MSGVTVPTQEQFDALAARVAALEAPAPPDPPPVAPPPVDPPPPPSAFRIPLPDHDPASQNFQRWLTGLNGSAYEHALAYRVTGLESHREKAIALAATTVAADTVAGNQYLGSGPAFRNVFTTLDWCQPTPEQRAEWLVWGKRHLGETDGSVQDSLWWSSRWSRNNPANNYYHSFMLATSCYAMAAQDAEWLAFLKDDRLPRMHAYYSTTPEGGSREGTGYGESHRRVFELAKFWRDYDGTKIVPQEFVNNSILYWTHATTPGHGWVALIGDHTRSHGKTDGYHRHIIGAALALADDPEAIAVAHWQLSKLQPNTSRTFFPLELRDYPEGSPPSTLDYHAAGAGHFFSRTSWEPDATYLVCTAGKFDEAHQQQDQGAFAVFAAGRWQTCSDSPWTHGGIAQTTAYQNVVRFAQPQKRGTSGTLTHVRDGNELRVDMDLSAPAQNPWRRQVIYAGGDRIFVRDWCDTAAEWGFCKPSEDDTRAPYVSEAVAVIVKLTDGFLSTVEWGTAPGSITMAGLLIATGGGAVAITGSPPLPPGVVQAEAMGETSIRITWANDAVLPANAKSFVVERSTDQETWDEVGTVTALTIDDTGRTAGTTYYYRVTSRNAWGSSSSTAAEPVTTPSAGPPDAPSDLQATTLSSGSVALAWTDNSDNDDGFDVQWDTVNTFDSDPQTIEAGPHSPAYTVTGLTAETLYYFRVRATNGAGDSAWTTTASATTDAEGSAVFSLTAVPDATVGITADIATWYSTDLPAVLGGPVSGTHWWLWEVKEVDPFDSGKPWLTVGHHRPAAGTRFYRNTHPTSGELAFTHATSDLGFEWTNSGYVTGGLQQWDFDGDGDPDLSWFVDSSANAKQKLASGYPSETTYTQTDLLPSGGNDRFDLFGDLDGDGTLVYEMHLNPQWPTSTVKGSDRFTWNGTGWTAEEGTVGPPEGVPSELLTELATYLYDGTTIPKPENRRFIVMGWFYCDIDGDGNDELIYQQCGAYGSPNVGAYLKWNGSSWVDMTSTWGLPREGAPLLLRQFQRPFRQLAQVNAHLHESFDDSGGFAMFIWQGTAPGYYKWNGSGWTRQTDSPLSTRLELSDSYPVRLMAVDLTNSGRIDVVMQRPRSGNVYVFLNDGDGGLTEYSVGRQLRSWDATGVCIADLDGNGLPEIILGGDAGADSGVTSGITARCLSIWQNTTTSPGNHLKVKLRRASGGAPWGTGGTVEVYVAGQSFAPSALIRRWFARPDGIPLIFGVGNRSTVDLKVNWPGGDVTTQTAVNVNQTVTVTEVDE